MSKQGPTKNLEQAGSLSVTSCVTILMGAMIGSAIFSLSGVTYAMAGPAHIITWILAAALLLVYGLVAAELACLYPVNGGLYVYPREVLGTTRASKEFWGWTSAWAYLNPSIFGASFAAIYVSTYLGRIIPAFADYTIPLAIIACIICGVLNIFKISIVGKVNLVLVAFMSLVLVIYSLYGFTAFTPENFTPFFTQGDSGAVGFIEAMPNAMLAYGAIVSLVAISSDIKNPKRTIPKAMIISVVLTAILYVLAVIATIGMIPTADFITNHGNQYYPMYAAIDKAVPQAHWLAILISLAALLALFTTMLVLIMSAGRTLAAAAQTGFLPAFLAKVNPKTNTPVAAIIVSTIVITIIACFPQFVRDITATGATAKVVTIALMVATLLVARRKFTHNPENYRLPGGSVLPIIVVILLIAFLFFQSLRPILLCAGWFAIGFIIYGIALAASKGKTNKA